MDTNEQAKKFSIAIVCDMVPGQPGGSFVSTLRFARMLSDRGHKVVILAARDKRKPAVESFNGIKICQFFSLPTPGSKRYYFISFPRARAVREIFLKEKIDVLHNMFPSYSCFISARAAKKMGIPIVWHSHTQPENVSVFLPKFLRSAFLDRLIMRVLAWFMKPAKIIITPSKLGEKLLADCKPNLDVRVVSNGVDFSKFGAVSAEPFFQKYNLSKGDKHILFIGRLTAEKGSETLVRAMAKIAEKIPNVHLELIGVGPLRDKLEEICRAEKTAPKISFLGKISDEDLLMAYSACDLFVLPSLVELEGMVVLEAMACGKPILIADSKTSASVYFVKENGLLFEPNSADDLAEKAAQILNDGELRAKMGRNSFSDAQNYDIRRSVEKLEAIYAEVSAAR